MMKITKQLADICDLITDGKHGDCKDELNSGYYFISAKDVKDGKIEYKNARQITEDDFLDTHKRTRYEPEDILITNSGTIGRMAFATNQPQTFRTTFQKSVAILKPRKDSVFPKWLYYSIQENMTRIADYASGTAQKNLLLKDLRTIEIDIPEIELQRRIASILSAYDDLIENNTRRIKILEDMARLIYREWFVEFRAPGVRLRKATPEEKKVTGKDMFPEGWEVSELSKWIKLDKGLSYNGKGLTEDGIPMVNLKNFIVGGGFRREGTKPYSGDYNLNHVIKEHDIIIANTDLTQAGNVIGSPALIPGKVFSGELIFTHHLYAVRIINEQTMPNYYLYHLLLSDDFKSFAKSYASGTTVLGLPREGVLNFKFAMASEQIKNAFEELTKPIYQFIDVLNSEIDNLRITRDMLLPKLISGEVEV